ncbi:hypothetical protein PLEOSDRAFT_156241 [Pleurotus ostreatus PC15]|uniref:F-box domain-containing protein n=1 Tax=Pleurotus ostreatus (strain PC15) TaxID=1137138 RepID=A0A067NUI5_PLEO1|nr:hypothetical protein PLEOSDRAFT_156241 [Pleurotus ostreatus PC15]
MAAIIPVEIARIIAGYLKDKQSLLNLLLVSHAFRLLAEPYLYNDVSFCQQREHTIHNFLLGLTASGGRCTHFVKRLRLPIIPPLRSRLYTSYQTVLTLVPNLEDLQFYPSRSTGLLKRFDLQDFLNGPSSPPVFMLKRFAWHSRCSLDSIGLTWFLASQKSLECLSLMTFYAADAIPTLPRLRVLHALNLAAARRSLETNQVTHLRINNCTTSLDLNDAALLNVVVCVLCLITLEELSEAAVRMPNLECVEINVLSSPIPTTLSRLNVLKAATKLHHLRIRTAVPRHWQDHPWDHNDVLNAFDSLPSLSHISIQLVPAMNFPEYYHFTKGVLQPTKIRSLYPELEWWHDWMDDHATVRFALNEPPQIGYQGDLHDAAGESEDQDETSYFD